MATGFWANRRVLAAAVLVLGMAWTWRSAGPGAAAEDRAPAEETVQARARTRAQLLHGVYASTLEAMHHHFFRTDRSVLPARAMEDVFRDMEQQTKIKTKWIAVNARAMNIDHEPKSDFEKQAARALAAGKGEFERVEDGYYHRAGAIPLSSGCVSCHAGLFARSSPSSPRVAGLVISIPLTKK